MIRVLFEAACGFLFLAAAVIWAWSIEPPAQPEKPKRQYYSTEQNPVMYEHPSAGQ